MDNKSAGIKQVIATLQDGAFSYESRKRILLFGIIGCVFYIIGFACLIWVVLESGKNSEDMTEVIFTVVGCCIAALFLVAATIYLIVRNEKIRTNIFNWMEDAVELRAFAQTVNVEHVSFLFPRAKLQVTFTLDGKHYKKTSGRIREGKTRTGYQNYWMKFNNKNIRILYSPKYDQVILLQD